MKKTKFLFATRVIITCLSVFSGINCLSQTSISGGIVSGVWTLAGSPYLIQGSVNIPNGSTLTIEPGVTVSFQTSSKLTMIVEGRLLAIGTESDTIRFTAADTTNGFKGIRFNNLSSNNDTSKIIYCRFEYGKSTEAAPYDKGGALFFNNWGKAIVSRSYISNCWAASKGAGICCDSSSNPIISYNTIIYNIVGAGSSAFGGGIACLNNSSPAISYNTISYNSTSGCGGGISCEGVGTNPSITFNTISYNTSNNMSFMVWSDGAGIYCNSAKPTISYNLISYNANLYLGTGGGIFCRNIISFPAITHNTIIYNSSSAGGGIGCDASTLSGINFNIISNNYANNFSTNPNTNHGGGIYCNGSTISSMSNNSITNNYAPDYGGAFYLNQSNLTSAINNTIANNKADLGGAVYCENNADPTFRNCILYGNTAVTSGSQVYLFDDASDPKFYYSDVQDSLSGFGLNGNVYTGVFANNINSNPLFISPSGGSGDAFDGVSANWSLQNNSPCKNTGDPATLTPVTDILGNKRVTVCRIDQGAYENQYAQPIVLTKTTINTVCGQLCTGSATANVTGGALPITFYWLPGNQTTQTISSQCVGTYTVTVTDANGCNKTTTAVISANPTMTSSFTKTPVSCNGGSNGTATVNVNNGVSPYGFSWSTAPAQTTQTATGLSAITYTVTVTDSNGCSITPTVTITQPTAISLNKSKTNASCIDNDGTASVAPSGGVSPYIYLWSTTATTTGITGLSSGVYSITVTDFNNCIKSDTINISINTSAAPNPAQICMVTVDDASINNIVYWDKTSYTNIDSFIVYRETVSNTYKRIGAVSKDSLSMFIDTVRAMYFPFTGDPNTGTYRYKLKIRDTCGNYSPLSFYHNTIYATQTGGTFNWNDYKIEGQTIPLLQLSAYYLYRDNNNTNSWTLVGGVSGSQLTINDPAYSSYTNGRWRIETLWNIVCSPTRATVNTTRSNIKHQSIATEINPQQGLGAITIYPNPANESITIELNQQIGITTIKIINVLGQLMEDEIVLPASTKTLKQINVSAYAKGIYTIVIESNKAKTFKKLVIN